MVDEKLWTHQYEPSCISTASAHEVKTYVTIAPHLHTACEGGDEPGIPRGVFVHDQGMRSEPKDERKEDRSQVRCCISVSLKSDLR